MFQHNVEIIKSVVCGILLLKKAAHLHYYVFMLISKTRDSFALDLFLRTLIPCIFLSLSFFLFTAKTLTVNRIIIL